MKTLIKYLFFLTFISISLQSCFISKIHKGKKILLDSTTIYNTVQNSNLKFKSLKAKYSAQLFNGNNEQTIGGFIKIYHDSIIKVTVKSAFVNLANIHIRKDTIEIHSLFFQNQGYNYNEISNIYGINANYNLLENLLIDNLFTYPHGTKLYQYNISVTDSFITLTYRIPAPQNNLLSIYRDQIIFSTLHKKIIKHNIWDFSKSNIELYIIYSNFILINNQKIPSLLNLHLVNNDDTLKLLVNYEKISIQ